MLDKLSANFDIRNIGLYRDDGISPCKNKNGCHNYYIRKKIIKTLNTN